MDNGSWGTEHWPTEIRVKRSDKEVEIDFDNGVTFAYPAELLRVESPSAEVQGHSASQKTVVAGKARVGIVEVEPVGHYAIRIRFDDGHATGIYSWRYLYEMGENKESLEKAYLAALAARGLSRE